MQEDILPKEYEFSYASKNYVLTEAFGDAEIGYENAIIKCAKPVDGKPTSAEGIPDIDPKLVADCLYETSDTDGKRTPVSVKELRAKFPGRLIKQLAKRVKQMSDMDGATVEGIDKQIEALQEQKAGIADAKK